MDKLNVAVKLNRIFNAVNKVLSTGSFYGYSGC